MPLNTPEAPYLDFKRLMDKYTNNALKVNIWASH